MKSFAILSGISPETINEIADKLLNEQETPYGFNPEKNEFYPSVGHYALLRQSLIHGLLLCRMSVEDGDDATLADILGLIWQNGLQDKLNTFSPYVYSSAAQSEKCDICRIAGQYKQNKEPIILEDKDIEPNILDVKDIVPSLSKMISQHDSPAILDQKLEPVFLPECVKNKIDEAVVIYERACDAGWEPPHGFVSNHLLVDAVDTDEVIKEIYAWSNLAKQSFYNSFEDAVAWLIAHDKLGDIIEPLATMGLIYPGPDVSLDDEHIVQWRRLDVLAYAHIFDRTTKEILNLNDQNLHKVRQYIFLNEINKTLKAQKRSPMTPKKVMLVIETDDDNPHCELTLDRFLYTKTPLAKKDRNQMSSDLDDMGFEDNAAAQTEPLNDSAIYIHYCASLGALKCLAEEDHPTLIVKMPSHAVEKLRAEYAQDTVAAPYSRYLSFILSAEAQHNAPDSLVKISKAL